MHASGYSGASYQAESLSSSSPAVGRLDIVCLEEDAGVDGVAEVAGVAGVAGVDGVRSVTPRSILPGWHLCADILTYACLTRLMLLLLLQVIVKSDMIEEQMKSGTREDDVKVSKYRHSTGMKPTVLIDGHSVEFTHHCNGSPAQAAVPQLYQRTNDFEPAQSTITSCW